MPDTQEGEKTMSDSFDQMKAVIDLYIKSSDSFIKIALVVIAASVAFPTKEWPVGFTPPTLLLLSWFLLLASVGFGCLYQYLAIHLLDSISDLPGTPGLLKRWIPRAGWIYGAMMITFFPGALLAL